MKVVLQSINTQIEFYFLHVSVLMGPSSGSIVIVRLKLFELLNVDPYLVQHVHIIKIKLKLKCKNYDINIIKILKVYKELDWQTCIWNILAHLIRT
jgi:hypothetical protein